MYKFLSISRFPALELTELIKQNIIGTPGLGMLYQHLESIKKIEAIPNPYFVSLNKDSNILGTCCFCSRDTINAGKTFSSFYLRYFTFKSGFRTKNKTKREDSNSKNSGLREEIRNVLSGEGLGDKAAAPKFFHYAYVDPRNIRSALLCKEFGFETVRSFSTLIFNRISPKEDVRVTACIESEQIEKVKKLLQSFYKDHTMFSMENLFNLGTYYTISDEKGYILAGVQATSDSWKILELPGLSGKIILNVFSSLPYLKRLFNKKYEFLTLEGVYYSPGNEKYLEVLFESLLKKYKRNSAMVWVDSNSTMYQHIRPLDWGIIDKINKEVQASVICRFNNFSQQEVNKFKENPAYISGIDLT